MTPEETERARTSLGGRTACTNKVFKDTSSLLAICKKDADELKLGEGGAIALFNSRAGLVVLPKPKAAE